MGDDKIVQYGYEVLSLDGLINRLSTLREAYPELGQRPVVINNVPPMYWPVKDVSARPSDGRNACVHLIVEKG